MTATKADLLEQKASLIAYLASKVKAGDWHACQDAASDIRDIEAKLSLLTEIEQTRCLASIHDPSDPHRIGPTVPEWQAELDRNPALAKRLG